MESFVRDGLTFSVRDEGSPDAEPVVALHGFPQTARMWSGVAPLVTEAGYRFVAPDERGYSVGARPAGIKPYAQRELVADAAALIEALDRGPVHVVGHDWGGAAAWALAWQRPDLLRSLAVLSTPHPAAYRRALLGAQLMKSWYFLAFQPPRWPERAMLARDAALLRRTLQRSGLDGAATAHAVDVLRSGAATPAVNWYRGLRFGGPAAGPISTPTLYVYGDRDRFLSRGAARLTRHHVFGPYRYEQIVGGSHWLADERPGQVADLLLDHWREHG